MHVYNDGDLDKALSAAKRSHELINEAIRANEPTGQHAGLEESDEDGEGEPGGEN
jgi:hypothetical protein